MSDEIATLMRGFEQLRDQTDAPVAKDVQPRAGATSQINHAGRVHQLQQQWNDHLRGSECVAPVLVEEAEIVEMLASPMRKSTTARTAASPITPGARSRAWDIRPKVFRRGGIP
jgi:hypothetical protein